ncbi:extracellular solute-binding protein [Microbacterium fluvii]|uniref:Extracellular solute-binding protein n=1 Tax=Microbacterium fluvii TaxID=415215 RepID=A0ABW2HIT2_9MICO|nr:extracellular solute-binding protein [Microbacterium fluvii]MCU4673072.1 extracellular solute-binding protein [Microbacterium fluvii]
MHRIVGLTWDHPRGHDALAAAATSLRALDVDLRWEVHPLEGFESAPIADLAAGYDLIVLDHPHLGDALAADCLQPMEEVIGDDEIAALSSRVVGPSLRSYQARGLTWALPLDAATQVAACRADLSGSAPTTWEDVRALSYEAPVALSVSGPHAYLTFASVCHGLGSPLAHSAAERIVDDAVGLEAIALLADLFSRAPEGSGGQNPIALLERMCATDEIAYIPLVYGYVNYADRARRHPLEFGPSPVGRGGCSGSTIGGTGLAVTRRAEVPAALRAHLVWLLSDSTQAGFIPRNAGQPSAVAAWEDAELDARFGGFYRRTRSTIDTAWVRPRFAGFTAVQSEMSHVLRDAMRGAVGARDALRTITSLQNNEYERSAAADVERSSLA